MSGSPARPAARWAPAAWLALAVALVGGALCGEAGWFGVAIEQATEAPPGWRQDASLAVWERAALSGPLAHHPSAWSLEAHRAIRIPRGERSGAPQRLALEASIPPGGLLEIWLSEPSDARAAALILERIDQPSARLVSPQGGRYEQLRCDAALPAPDDGFTALSVAQAGPELVVSLGGLTTRCQVPAGSFQLPILQPGLRRVLIRDLQLDDTLAPSPAPPRRWLAWLLGATAALLLVVIELRGTARREIVLLSTAGLLLAAPLAHADLGILAEHARIASWFPPAWLGLAIPVGLTLLAKATHHLGRIAREPDARQPSTPGWHRALVLPGLLERLGSTRPLGTALLLFGLGLVGLGAGVLLSGPSAGGAIALMAVSYGGLVWANANARRIRFYNLVSLLSAGCLFLGAELLLRSTDAGSTWDAARPMPMDGPQGGPPPGAPPAAGHPPLAPPNAQPGAAQGPRTPQPTSPEEGLVEEFEAMAAREHTVYPSHGWPVAFPPPDGRPRVVVMGGSTTGGAWQNDNLNEFYPARLAERLGSGVQVLNQGVGGWTTWHIRHYLEGGQLAPLAPDILVLYVGHNDILTETSLPYSLLYERWQKGGVAREGSRLLNSVRLYQGLRYLLLALRPSSLKTAVPIDEARENIDWIIREATRDGGDVVLVTEGLSPDPGPLTPYNDMMRQLAQASPRVHYLDAAAVLAEHPSRSIFLDDCHLTDRGHRMLADQLHGLLAPLLDQATEP